MTTQRADLRGLVERLERGQLFVPNTGWLSALLAPAPKCCGDNHWLDDYGAHR